MESEEHIKSMYGETCLESVRSSPLGIFYVYPFIFSALLMNACFFIVVMVIPFPFSILVSMYLCGIVKFNLFN